MLGLLANKYWNVLDVSFINQLEISFDFLYACKAGRTGILNKSNSLKSKFLLNISISISQIF